MTPSNSTDPTGTNSQMQPRHLPLLLPKMQRSSVSMEEEDGCNQNDNGVVGLDCWDGDVCDGEFDDDGYYWSGCQVKNRNRDGSGRTSTSNDTIDDDSTTSSPPPQISSATTVTTRQQKQKQVEDDKVPQPTATTASSSSSVCSPIGLQRHCRLGTVAVIIVRVIVKSFVYTLIAVSTSFALYYLAASPPLHWFGFVRAPYAGPNSVYLPGGGFSGFWFHLGYLQSIPQQHLHEYDYYCFSAGCLSILSVFMNRSLDEVSHAAFAAQESWLVGNQSRFDLVDYFFDELMMVDRTTQPQREQQQQPGEHFQCHHNHHGGVAIENGDGVGDYYDMDNINVTTINNRMIRGRDSGSGETRLSDDRLSSFLPRIKVLVTTMSDGFRVEEPQDIHHLKELIIRTTWVPYLTGWGFLSDAQSNDIYLDGGFSRMLHPPCETSLHLPLIWETLIHTFSPGLTSNQVLDLWMAGSSFDYKLPRSTSPTTTTSKRTVS